MSFTSNRSLFEPASLPSVDAAFDPFVLDPEPTRADPPPTRNGAVQRCVASCAVTEHFCSLVSPDQPRQCSDRRMRLQAAATVQLRCPAVCGLS